MAFWFQCPNCQSKHVANDEVIDQPVVCPQCSKSIVVKRPQQTDVIPDAQLEQLPGKIIDKRSIVRSTTPVEVVPSSDDEFDTELPAPLFRKAQPEESEMDMTPMVDVTFLLLIFFMVTASFTVQKAMNRPTDTSDEPSMVETEEDEDDPDLVQVDIDEFNSFFVIGSQGEPVEAPSKQDLVIALRDAKEGGTDAGKKLLIRAHVDSYHERTVTAMDVGTDLDYQMQVQILEEL